MSDNDGRRGGARPLPMAADEFGVPRGDANAFAGATRARFEREQEQRQRSARFMMMMLLMMILMEDKDQAGPQNMQNQQARNRNVTKVQQRLPEEGHLRKPKKPKRPRVRHAMNESVYEARRSLDKQIMLASASHPRYQRLFGANGDVDHDSAVRNWVYHNIGHDTDDKKPEGLSELADDNEEVSHYPWNSTGMYRSTWERIPTAMHSNDTMHSNMISEGLSIGLHILPNSTLTNTSHGSNTPDPLVGGDERAQSDVATHTWSWWSALFGEGDDESNSASNASRTSLPLTLPAGQASFLLNSRTVPAMNEISLLEGYIKLHNSMPISLSTSRDSLVRVRGVMIHSIGRISLVSVPSSNRSVMILGGDDEKLHQSSISPDKQASDVQRLEGNSLTKSDAVIPYPFVPDDDGRVQKKGDHTDSLMSEREKRFEANTAGCDFEIIMDVEEVPRTLWEWKDMIKARIDHTFRLNPKLQNTSRNETVDNAGASDQPKKGKRSQHDIERSRNLKWKSLGKQSLVSAMNGTIYSPNCDFYASLNATAIRTDWNEIEQKGMRYSSFMLLVCLTQIVLLLRQLLHTQSQPNAARVSLLCVGWQTVLDALLCLTHIYLSLAMKRLFTAFASVAFFKLLLFCVIEMKYMAIIIQARNSHAGGVNADVLRRQVAMLHLRFYVALVGSFLAFLYGSSDETYKMFCLFILYSFWVPQIVLNAVTEAKNPLHKHYIIGMSITRLVPPLYLFGVEGNVVANAYHISFADAGICRMLIFWVGVQVAILFGQSQRGARFMIPEKLLPPKFDYSRPIPESLIAEATTRSQSSTSPSVSLGRERSAENPSEKTQSLVTHEASPLSRSSNGVTRKRIKGGRATKTEICMTAETISSSPEDSSLPRFDCVICYNPIDIRNRAGYMLPPCDHLFHRDCLSSWMEVKTECPVCRANLPVL